MSQLGKKRKVDTENRAFNTEWTKKYLFIQRLGQAQCLICLKTIAVCKEFNVRRHWESQHQDSKYASLSATEKEDAIAKLSNQLEKTTSMFQKSTTESNKVT